LIRDNKLSSAVDPSVADCTAVPVISSTSSTSSTVYLNVGDFYNETLTADATSGRYHHSLFISCLYVLLSCSKFH